MAPIDRHGASAIQRNRLQFKIVFVAKNQAAICKGGVGEVGPESLCIQSEKPGGGDCVFMPKDKRQAAEKSVRFGGDFPSGGLRGALNTFFRGEKRVSGSKGGNRAGMGNFWQRESFGLGGGGERSGRDCGGKVGGEGTSELVILSGFKGIGGVEW